MRVCTMGKNPGSRETYEAVLISEREAATLRKADRLLHRMMERVGSRTKHHDPRFAHLDDYEAGLLALPDDDPLVSATVFLSECIDQLFQPGTSGEYPVPNSGRPVPRRGS